MARATLSLIGLYNYDPTVLDGLKLPAALDREVVVDNLLLETEPFELLYPSAKIMRTAIERWSRKELPVWERLQATTEYEYNPIENYDRHAEWSDEEDRTTMVKSESDGETNNSQTFEDYHVESTGDSTTTPDQYATTTTRATETDTVTTEATAFNSDELVTTGKSTTVREPAAGSAGSETSVQSGTLTVHDTNDTETSGAIYNNTTDELNSESTTTDEFDRKHEEHVHGNIGVMST